MKSVLKFIVALAVIALAVSSHAQTAPTPLKSFAYASTGCSNGFLTFGTGSFQMGLGAGMAQPGSFYFPTGNFYIRKVSLTLIGGGATNWAIVGHSGPNGDWITKPAITGHDSLMDYDIDAAPLFTAGEFLDVHISFCDGVSGLVAVWWEPAP